jgi:hypothetical protein
MMSNIPYQDDILQFACDSLFSLPIDSMSLNQYPIEYDDRIRQQIFSSPEVNTSIFVHNINHLFIRLITKN